MNKLCIYKIYRVNLANLCEEFYKPLNHHNVLSYASACGELFKLHLNER